METISIGELAKAAEVGVETLRFYEREGLIPEPPRRMSGYRQYPPDTIRRVRFIRRAKDLGFSLKEIRELLSLRVAPDTSCADVRALAVGKIATIADKLAELERMRSILERLADTCSGDGPTSECPILEMLDDAERQGGSHVHD